ncbi:MAG: transcription termination/antitermination factor NusG [Bacteroidales bacterium]|nr:transcription termination/antitermination factor NusG [Candidatus Colicola coprequi]
MESNNLHWYVLRAISGKENKVKEYIESALVTSTLFREYVSQVLIPTEKYSALRNGKRVVKERNMLPGYVLVECNLTDECFPLLRNIPNVLGFLSDGKTSTKPAPVPQSEINKILNQAEESSAISEQNFMAGESVKIVNGPFNGFKGVISEVMQEKQKVKVNVPVFDRETSLELGFNDVEKE